VKRIRYRVVESLAKKMSREEILRRMATVRIRVVGAVRK
jgi:hypothetical protein